MSTDPLPPAPAHYAPVTDPVAFLRNFQAWRRGDEGIAMPHPRAIGGLLMLSLTSA